MIYEILYTLFSALVFPGIVFITALALFSEWFYRKTVARMQHRMGPAYTGPIGILQPFADILKLFLSKEIKKQRYSSIALAKVGLSIAIASVIVPLFMLPISPIRIVAPYDVIIFIYFYAVWHFIGLVLAVLAYPNPFTVAGLSRLIALTIVIEPTIFIAILVPVILSINCIPPYSIICAATNSGRLWFESPLSFIAMALATFSMIIASQAKLALKPFDIPEAEQELIAGHITEFSGPVLALYNISHDIKLALSSLLITYLFLGGPYPYKQLSIPGIILLITKYLVVLYVLSTIRAAYGRRRIDQGITFLMKYSLIPSIIALVLAIIHLILM